MNFGSDKKPDVFSNWVLRNCTVLFHIAALPLSNGKEMRSPPSSAQSHRTKDKWSCREEAVKKNIRYKTQAFVPRR